MNKEQTDILGLLTEECAEVIQAVSKAQRFGLHSIHKERSNQQNIQQEVGDVLALIIIMVERHPEIINKDGLDVAVRRKIERLKKYMPTLADFDLDKVV